MPTRPRTPWSAWLLTVPSLLAIVALLHAGTPEAAALDPLPSWRDQPSKKAIVEFVRRVTHMGTEDFVPPSQRIAVFDNDGTLWVEQPYYTQLAFAVDRVRALASKHPEWKTQQPFRAVLEEDFDTLAASGNQGLMQLLMATHAGMTTDQFEATVADWIAKARHPRYDRPYTELVYQPMVELLTFLRASGFKTFIVTGGGADFLRVFSEDIYGVPPEQVVGSRGAHELQVDAAGVPRIVKLARVEFVDDAAGKPVGIHEQIGRRPILAFGNSDGDRQMLQWTAAGEGPRFLGLVHHTDAAREWEYDRESKIGRLSAGLDEAQTKGWTVVDMERDWKRVFAFE